jgi:SAM-dependent methyltransferase
MDSTALEIEAKFADSFYSEYAHRLDISPTMFRRYSDPHDMSDWRQLSAHLLGDLRDKHVLDYGCGMGEESMYFAKLGAIVNAIDISPIGVELTLKRAQHNGLIDRVSASVMDALHTSFDDDTFDCVHGLGILHHVGLREGLTEIRRVLKPGGSGVFLEPIGNVRLIEYCKHRVHRLVGKRLNLKEVNEREENMKLRDIDKCGVGFSHFQVYPYHLIYRIRKLLLPQRLFPVFARIDYRLLRIAPFLKSIAGGVVIHVRK